MLGITLILNILLGGKKLTMVFQINNKMTESSPRGILCKIHSDCSTIYQCYNVWGDKTAEGTTQGRTCAIKS